MDCSDATTDASNATTLTADGALVTASIAATTRRKEQAKFSVLRMKTRGNTMRKQSAMLTISKENDIGDDTIQAVVLRQRA